MAIAVKLREDFSAPALRRLAARAKNVSQSRRLLSLAAVREGMNRTEAARIGGMDPSNAEGLGGACKRLRSAKLSGVAGGGPQVQRARTGGAQGHLVEGQPPRLSADQQCELAALVEAGPDRAVDGVVRWRRVDLQRVIKERFGVDYHERTVGKVLKALGFSHISARPQHPSRTSG